MATEFFRSSMTKDNKVQLQKKTNKKKQGGTVANERQERERGEQEREI